MAYFFNNASEKALNGAPRPKFTPQLGLVGGGEQSEKRSVGIKIEVWAKLGGWEMKIEDCIPPGRNHFGDIGQ